MTEGLTNKDKAKIVEDNFFESLKVIVVPIPSKPKPAGKRKPWATYPYLKIGQIITTQDLNKALTQALDKLSDIQNK